MIEFNVPLFTTGINKADFFCFGFRSSLEEHRPMLGYSDVGA